MNLWNPEAFNATHMHNPRNTANWDSLMVVNETIDYSAMTVMVEGAMTLDYVGFTSPGCLSLTSNGLVVEEKGAVCGQQREAVCEHQSCYTKEGRECIFPFTYKGEIYTKCTSIDVYQPWCATEFNTADNLIGGWGLCLEDCEYEEAIVSCLEPPPVPQFGIRNDSGFVLLENYASNWFSLEFINPVDGIYNHTHYKVSREQRLKLYQPWIPYDSSSLEDTNMEFIAESREDHFNDVYQIEKNESQAIYTCPVGWVFANSNNITHTATCINWFWVADFNTSAPCTRKYNIIMELN